jgi:hypothetical protein
MRGMRDKGIQRQRQRHGERRVIHMRHRDRKRDRERQRETERDRERDRDREKDRERQRGTLLSRRERPKL